METPYQDIFDKTNEIMEHYQQVQEQLMEEQKEKLSLWRKVNQERIASMMASLHGITPGETDPQTLAGIASEILKSEEFKKLITDAVKEILAESMNRGETG